MTEPDDPDGLRARIACVSRRWRPTSHLHPGGLCWAAAGGDGSSSPTDRLAWGEPLAGFADIRAAGLVAEVTAYVAPDAPRHVLAAIAAELAGLAPSVFVEATRQDVGWWAALQAEGFAEVGGPWFAQLHRDLGDTPDLVAHGLPPLPEGFHIRPAGDDPDEVSARAALHRRCWAPARIKTMLGLPVDGNEPGSAYTDERHRRVRSTPLYRNDLDLVVEGPDGLCASALGWWDPGSQSIELEPVGTDPDHAGLGLARAVSAAVLRRAGELGATQAVVIARGDDQYPVPRRVYAGLGFAEIAQTVLLARRESAGTSS